MVCITTSEFSTLGHEMREYRAYRHPSAVQKAQRLSNIAKINAGKENTTTQDLQAEVEAFQQKAVRHVFVCMWSLADSNDSMKIACIRLRKMARTINENWKS